jgi:AraC-like DNA-binding protein
MAWGVSGVLRVNIESMGSFDLVAGHIIVITPGFKYELEVLSEKCEFRYVAIDGPQAGSVILAAGLWTGIFPCRDVPAGWLDDLAKLIDSENKDDQVVAISRAHDLFLFQAELAREMIRDNLVYQAQWYFHRNWHDCDVNIESAIKYLSVDRATLSKRFKRVVGVSMLEYLTGIRLTNAKRLLKTTSIHIAEISVMCGYRDSSYFSRIFKKKNLCTPLQYRMGKDYSSPVSESGIYSSIGRQD